MKKYLKFLTLFLIIGFCLLYFCMDTSAPKVDYTAPKTVNEDTLGELRKNYNNSDIVGTLGIDGADINEVLVQYHDNKYYLTHDLYKNHDIYGSVFLDYRCNKDSKKILIFGHNDFKEKTPFSNLENYEDSSYYKDHQFIDVLIEDKKMKFQIFSVYIETSDFTYMNLKIDDNKHGQDIIKYKSKSFYDTGVSVGLDDRILILQTCSNNENYKKFNDKYLLIIAKLV